MSDNIHESVLNKQLTLMLNKSWICIGYLTVKKAIVAMTGGDIDHPVMALDMTFDEWGNLLYANPVNWATWENLPIRDTDFYIQTNRKQIRCPTVVITRNFNKVPIKKIRVSSRAIYDRDLGRCQYSNKLLSRAQASLDHIIPRSRGGKDSFHNLVLCDKTINILKDDKTPEEAGLKLLKKPISPPDVPISLTITYPNHPDWKPFLIR